MTRLNYLSAATMVVVKVADFITAITDEAYVAKTAVGPIPFLIDMLTAITGSILKYL